MSIFPIYAQGARPTAGGVLVLSSAAVIAALLGDALPDNNAQIALMTAGWTLSALAAGCLALTSVGHRTQAVMWVVTLMGGAVTYGGLANPSVARALALLAVLVAFVTAVVSVIVLAEVEDARAQGRS